MEVLKSLEGYGLDLRSPGIDDVALAYAEDWFGPATVGRVLGKLHRSSVTKERMEEDIMQYNISYASGEVRSDPAFQLAVESVRDQLVPNKQLIPLTLGGVEQNPDFPKDRSPGLPWVMKGYKTKRDCLECPEARKVWHTKWDRIGRGRSEHLPDTAIYFRAQIANVDENKIRGVWGLPIDVVVEEGRFFYPYLEWMKSAKTQIPIAYQVEMATGGMEYVNQLTLAHRNATFLCGDWSKFDKRVPPWLIRTAFQILYDCFDMSHVRDSEGLVWPVNPEQSKRRFKRMVSYFINTPLRLPDGRRFRKSGGVPSGSIWTNMIDSIVNMIVMRYILYETTGYLPLGEVYLGDDSLCACKGIVNIEDLASLAEEKFGFILNTRKSYVTTRRENVHFLGYYNRNGRPFKATDFLIASFVYPERVVKTNEVRISRAMGQMWSTLNMGSALPWLRIIQHMLQDFGITKEQIDSYIRSHPGQFKYLRILGITSDMIQIPREVPEGAVFDVEPSFTPRRDYKPHVFNLERLMMQAAIRTGYFEENLDDRAIEKDDMAFDVG